MELAEYMRELILMRNQYGQEEELYPLINMLLRENDNVKHLSVRTVANGRSVNIKGDEEKVDKDILYGYAAYPDLVILDEKCKLKRAKKEGGELEKWRNDQIKLMYGCVEAKKLSEDLLALEEPKISVEIQFEDALLISKVDKNRPDYYLGFKESNDFSEKYTEYNNKVYKSLKNNEVLEWIKNNSLIYYQCIEEKYTSDKLKKLEGENPEIPKLDNRKFKFVRKKVYKVYKIEDGVLKDLKEIVEYKNDGFTELLGELLWYGKVLYTNGLVWKYLEIDNQKIRSDLFQCFVGNKDWRKMLENNEIQISCKEIANLSNIFEKIKSCKLEEVQNMIESDKNRNLCDDLREKWKRLKKNLSIINWDGSKKTEPFV